MNYYKRVFTRKIKALSDYFKDGAISLFPASEAFKSYTPPLAKRDMKAALDVALVGLPQGMAFAALAGLPIIFGILCATIGTLIGPLFSRSNLTVGGPSNATAFMMASFFMAHPTISDASRAQIVPVIVCLVGITCLIFSFAKVTDMMRFVSKSVLVGYISGAALLIIISQMKSVLGLNDPLNAYFAATGGGRTLFSMMTGIIHTLPLSDWKAIILSIITVFFYFIFKRHFKALPNFALVLVIMSLINWGMSQPWCGNIFSSVKMLQGFMIDDLKVSPPDLFNPDIFNQLYDIVPVVFGIAFLCILEQTLMTKTIATRTGEKVDLNQDTYSLGLTNIGLSFFFSLPSSASLSRSMLNYNSGAATRFSGMYCGFICLIITALLAWFPITSYIPASVLAALVVGNALSLFDFKAMRVCGRSTLADALVMWATFVATLLVPLHTAIFIGVGISILFFLRQAAKPELVEYTMNDEGQLKELKNKNERTLPTVSIVHVEGNLFFGAAEVFRAQVQRMTADASLKVIILRLKNARNLDATSVWALNELINFSREKNRHLLISGASKDVYRILKHSGVLKNLQKGCGELERNIFLYSPTNPNYSTRLALIRAQQLLGTKDADIQIFYNPHPQD